MLGLTVEQMAAWDTLDVLRTNPIEIPQGASAMTSACAILCQGTKTQHSMNEIRRMTSFFPQSGRADAEFATSLAHLVCNSTTADPKRKGAHAFMETYNPLIALICS